MKKIILLLVLCAALMMTCVLASADKEILNDQAVREIVLNGDGALFSCGGVTASGSVITISAPGVYSVSGKLDGGQIIVSVSKDEKVKILLNNADITSADSPAIYVSSADKVTLSVEEGTISNITSGTQHTLDTFDSSRSKAAIYSCDDLKISGKGTLNVYGLMNNGIGSKNDIDIKECRLNVFAANNGIKGNDSVEISGASINITAGNNGIKTDTSKDGKGYVTVTDTALTIQAEAGIQATGLITVVPSVN